MHEVPVPYETIDGFDTGLLEDFVRAFAQAASLTIHVRLRSGRSPHHICEAQFKAMATALGDACGLGRALRRAVDEGNPLGHVMTHTIAVADYGSGNLHSVSRALARVGGRALVTRDAEEIAAADALVIPGVGHFGACMRAICHHGLDRAIRDFRSSGRPLFGVCVGMQVLFESQRRGRRAGTGRAARHGRAPPRRREGAAHGLEHDRRGPRGTPTPTAFPTARGSTSSTRSRPRSPTPTVGTTTHGRPFAGAVAAGNVFATQFHPEKSSDAGLHLYERFVRSLA